MKVVFLDVEQGDSTLVILSDGTVILVDMNFKDNDFSKIKQYLTKNKLGEYVIDILILTHPHEDHIRGIGELYNQFTVKAICESGHRLFVSDKEKSKHYLDMINVIKKIKQNGNEHRTLKAYESYNIGKANMQVFSPTKAYLSEENPTERDIHDQCLVFKIEEAGFSVLFTGDSSMSAWEDYIVPNYSDVKGKPNLLKSTILSTSHHGSNTFFFPTSKAEGEPYTLSIEKINPIISVISAGVANIHGHPDRKALELYKQFSKDKNHVYQTKHSASIIVESTPDGNYKVFSEDFLKKCNQKGMENASAVIEATPQPDSDGFYEKQVGLEFQVKVSNYPHGHPADKIRWSVQNNSKKPDSHHDFYEGQNKMHFFYENYTAYLGEHILLCEVRDKNGKNICTKSLRVKVK